MKTSRVRVGISILVILFACGVAGFELKESLGPNETSEAQIGKLKSYWTARRRGAAAELGRFAGESDTVVPALVTALSDSDLQVRLNAIESLKSYDDKAKPAGPALREMLKHDPDGKVRQGAAALLGVIKDNEAVPLLVATLDDHDPAVRLEATRSLGAFGHGIIASPPIIDKLISALGADHPVELRDASIGALDSLARDQERVARAIAVAAVSDPSDQVRYDAVGVLKKAKFGCELPALIAALEDSSARVRLIAAGNLAWIGVIDDRIVPALCKAALKADSATRAGIGNNINLLILDRLSDKKPAEELTKMYETAVGAFRTVLETRDAAAHEQVLSVLGRLIAVYIKTTRPALLEPARTAVQAVLARMEDEAEEVPIRLLAMDQWTVLNLQGLVRSPRAGAPGSAAAASPDQLHPRALWIEAMGRQLLSPTVEVRSRAGEILVDNFKDRDSDPTFREAWRKAVPSLAKAAQIEDTKVRNGALTMLTKLGPAAALALPALRSLADHTGDESVKSAALGAIKSISSADDLNSHDPAVRAAGALALSRLGWPAAAAVPALATLLKDPEITVRLAAVKALQALGAISKAAVPALATALAAEADPAVRVGIVEALEAIDPGSPPVVDAHLHALRDPSPEVRQAGASFRAVTPDESVVSALEKTLGDPDEGVRQKVANTLTGALFENPTVVPAFLKGLRDQTQRKAVLEAVNAYLENNSDSAIFRQVRSHVPAVTATLGSAIPALKEALGAKDQEMSAVVYGLLGRIVSFAGLTRDDGLRRAVEPAVRTYVTALEESDPAVRQEVVGRLDGLPVGQKDIVAALQKFLERSDLSADERQTATAALEAQTVPPGSAAAKKSRRADQGGGISRLRH